MESFNKVDCSQSPIFCKIVEIERSALRAAILDECLYYLGAGGGGLRRSALNPDARPLGTYETKMAVRTAKRSILTILQKNRILWTVYQQCIRLKF